MAESAPPEPRLRFGVLHETPIEQNASPMGRLVSAIAAEHPDRVGTIGDAVKASLRTVNEESATDEQKESADRFIRAVCDYLDEESRSDQWRQRSVAYVRSLFDPQIVAAAECLTVYTSDGKVDLTRAAIRRITRLVSAKDVAITTINSTEMRMMIFDSVYSAIRGFRLDGSQGVQGEESDSNSRADRNDNELSPADEQLFHYWFAQEQIAKGAEQVDGERKKGGRPSEWIALRAMFLQNESRPDCKRWTDDELVSRYNRTWKGKSMGRGKGTYPHATVEALRRVRSRLLSDWRVSDDTPDASLPKPRTKPRPK